MPRTIRKRQLRNKKSRKQRGGVNEQQIEKINAIKETINKSIVELIDLLREPQVAANQTVV